MEAPTYSKVPKQLRAYVLSRNPYWSMTPDDQRAIIADLSELTQREIQAKWGITYYTIRQLRRQLHIRISPEHALRKRQRISATLSGFYSTEEGKETRAAQANILRQHLDRDRRRIKLGLTPITRQGIHADPGLGPKIKHARYRLRLQGYHIDYASNTCYYDDSTRQCKPLTQKKYESRYNFHFRPITERDQPEQRILARHDHLTPGEM